MTTQEPPSSTPPPASDAESALFCPECGYDLRGLSGDRCPECGLVVDREHLAAGQIPWEHRGQIGRVRALVRTLGLSASRLAREGRHEVSWADARRFRWIVVMLAWVPWAIVFIASAGSMHGRLYLWNHVTRAMMRPSRPGELDLLIPWVTGASFGWVIALAALLFLAGASGVHTFWYRPAGLAVARQNRAMALSHYAVAPLAWLGFAGVLAGFCFLVDQLELWNEPLTDGLYLPELAMLAWWAMLAILLAVPVALLIYHAILLDHTTHGGLGAALLSGAGVVGSWIGLAAVSFGALPWLVGWCALVYESLL